MGDTPAVGRVTELWRYPVKSMQGEQVASIELSAAGVAGDRAFGLVDASTGRLLSAKAVPALLDARARFVEESSESGAAGGGAAGGPAGGVVITLPDGREVGSDDPDVGAVLSTWLGRQVELRRSGGASGNESVEFELRADPIDDDGDLFAWPARAGSFLDSAPVHVMTTASLATMSGFAPESAWDVRRFRPNVLIDAGVVDGFVEDGWIGQGLVFGPAGAIVSVEGACGRCAMPNRAQAAVAGGSVEGGAHSEERPALARDIGVFRALTAEHGNDLGVYADVRAGGPIASGDEVHLTA